MSHASILTIILISIERFRVIRFPLRFRFVEEKSPRIIPFIWLLCVLVNIPWFYMANYRESSLIGGGDIKVCRLSVKQHWQKVYTTVLFVMFFVLPFVVLTILYCFICCAMRHTQELKVGQNNFNSQQFRKQRRLRLQVINIIVCLVFLFFIFHLPYRIFSMWITHVSSKTYAQFTVIEYYSIFFGVRISFYLNHSVNPILYNFVSTKFRNGFKNIIYRRSQRSSLFSSHRRANYNTPLTKPKHSLVLFMERDVDNRRLMNGRTSSSSSSRHRMAEFYPMYANVAVKGNSRSSLKPDAENYE